jgi:hypothetical protein
MTKDADGKQEPSQAFLTVYRALFDELRFAKQQQWTITNYFALVIGTIFGVQKSFGRLEVCEKVISTAIVLLSLTYCVYFLVAAQRHVGKTRARLEEVRKKGEQYFRAEEINVLGLEEDPSPYRRGLSFLIPLIGVSVIGAAIVTYSLWR